MALPLPGAAPAAPPMMGADPSQPPLGAAPLQQQGPDPMALMAMMQALKKVGPKRHKGKGKH